MRPIVKTKKRKGTLIAFRKILLLLVFLSVVLCTAFFGLAFQQFATTKPPNSWSEGTEKHTTDAEDRPRIEYESIGGVNDDSKNIIPQWMKEYFKWHKEQRYLLRGDNLQAAPSMRFLLMECWPWNPICGGTADRLRSIPFMILVAHQTERLLLIKWGRPAELEEFLLPPKGGLDWRVPPWLLPRLANQSRFHAATRVEKLVQIASMTNETVITTRLQSHDHGAEYYNAHRRRQQDDEETEEPLLRDVYRSVWQKVFTPTTPIAKLIQQQLKSLHLMPGEYAATHVRALYLEVARKPEQLQRFAENAVNCASMLRPGGPIYFASDSKYATQMALAYGKTIGSHVVVARTTGSLSNNKEPLHLDKTNGSSNEPSDFYDTFVDLYLLGMSRCLTYNIGGFGKWGLLLGYNSSCGMRHQTGYGFKKDGLAKCHWEVAPIQATETGGFRNNVQAPPLLLPPPTVLSVPLTRELHSKQDRPN
jgi:hypothetical protein